MLIDNIPSAANIELDVKCNGHTMVFNSNIEFIIDNSILISAIK